MNYKSITLSDGEKAIYKQLVRCQQNLDDCFAYSNGRCKVLHDTHFKRRCPFHKPRTKKE